MKHNGNSFAYIIPCANAIISGSVQSIIQKDYDTLTVDVCANVEDNNNTCHLYVCSRDLPVKGDYYVSYARICRMPSYIIKKCEIGCEYLDTASRKGYFVDGELIGVRPNVVIATTDASLGLPSIDLPSIIDYCNHPSDELNVEYNEQGFLKTDFFGKVVIHNPDAQAWNNALKKAEKDADKQCAELKKSLVEIPDDRLLAYKLGFQIDYLRKNYNIHTK